MNNFVEQKELPKDKAKSPMDIIHEVGRLEMSKVLIEYEPVGKYLFQSTSNMFIAADVTTHDVWIEHFETKEEAVAWLNDTAKAIYE